MGREGRMHAAAGGDKRASTLERSSQKHLAPSAYMREGGGRRWKEGTIPSADASVAGSPTVTDDSDGGWQIDNG